MSAKLKFVRMKPKIRFHPVYKQWVVTFPGKNRPGKPHSVTCFSSWQEAINFAICQQSNKQSRQQIGSGSLIKDKASLPVFQIQSLKPSMEAQQEAENRNYC